jgi:hypothetical protein
MKSNINVPKVPALKPVKPTVSTVKYSPSKSWHGHTGTFADNPSKLYGVKPMRIPKNKTSGEGAVDGE